MAEHKFTQYFKKNLSLKLNESFDKNEYELRAIPEYSVQSLYGRNAIDIGIISDDYPNRIVGIEIEYISSANQISLNRDKFRNWVHNSKNRVGGLLHMICDDATISDNKLYELLIKSYSETSKGKSFFYEFYALKSFDRRETLYTADYIIDDWEFDARLFSLIINAVITWRTLFVDKKYSNFDMLSAFERPCSMFSYYRTY